MNSLPLAKALITIFLATLFITGSTFLSFLYYQHVRELQKRDPNYLISTIKQRTSSERGFTTDYLAELLELSIDKPTNLYLVDIDRAKRKILEHPCVRSASVSKEPPTTLVIDYEMRNPVAFVGPINNLAIDRDGDVFPFEPFYKELELPTIYFDHDPSLALKILRETKLPMTLVDTCQAEAASFGQRQIIVTMANGDILRLTTGNFEDELKRYVALPESSEARVIDLRIPKLAFLNPSGVSSHKL